MNHTVYTAWRDCTAVYQGFEMRNGSPAAFEVPWTVRQGEKVEAYLSFQHRSGKVEMLPLLRIEGKRDHGLHHGRRR